MVLSRNSKSSPVRAMMSALAGLLLVVLLPWQTASAGAEKSALLCDRNPRRCVENVEKRMERRFRPLARSCDHDAVFALLYLRTTEEVALGVDGQIDDITFDDPGYIAREDVVFASYYFTAYDNWHMDRHEPVPEAWRIAFRAADEQQVSGSGNMLLGANAHINRDLPYVLAELGLVNKYGDSAKPDHNRINEILKRVAGPAVDEIAARFDPSVDDATLDGTDLDTDTFVELLASWRESAWQHAEQLIAADTTTERQVIVEAIETEAVAIAESIRAQTSYVEPLTTPAVRNAYCAEHG